MTALLLLLAGFISIRWAQGYMEPGTALGVLLILGVLVVALQLG